MMFYRIGAIMYVIWGFLHLKAALLVYRLGQSLEPGMVQGRIFQDAWNLLFFAIVAIVIALWMNWRNSRVGYWINLIAVTATDIGFIIFVLLPGYVAWWPGLSGPVFWVLGVVFTTLGLTQTKQPSTVI